MYRVFAVFACVLLAACNPQSGNAPATGDAPPRQTFEWKMVTTWPANFPVFQDGIEQFAKDLDTLSQGRLKVKVYSGGQLVPPLEAFNAVSQGAVQMGHGAAYYWAGKVPAAQFMSSVPFGMTAEGMHNWLYAGGGLELWRELYKPFNVVPFPAGNTGVQMGGWFNKRIDSLADLQGLKMRIPGLGGKVLAKAGGSPLLLAGGEIYTALERGVLDATEWVSPFHDQLLGLNRVAKYYYYPGWHEPGTSLELIVNQQAWDALPADLQRLVEVTITATNARMFYRFETMNLAALQELKDRNVEVLQFPTEVLAELYRLSGEVLEEEAAKNADFKRVYEAYQAFRRRNDAWNAVSDTAYERAHPTVGGGGLKSVGGGLYFRKITLNRGDRRVRNPFKRI